MKIIGKITKGGFVVLKNISKHLLGFTVALFVVLSLATTTSAAGTITGNNSFATAYSVGYWKYSNIDMIQLFYQKTRRQLILNLH